MKQGTSSPGYPTLTTRFVRAALNQTYKSETVNHFSLVTTDSRKIQRGCLFVALKGDRFDGHAFIDSAIRSGAAGILVKKGTKIPKSGPPIEIFEVDDTLEAYRALAGAWRREFDIPVVVVAGSVGKTTTKELLTSLLRAKWPNVLKTEASQNGFIGVAMTLLELRPEHDAAVIEVGIDEPGAMEKHIPLICANAVVLTAIGPEHLEKLIDIETVAKEECKAFELIAKTGGTVFVNLDDPWITKGASQISAFSPRFEFTLEAVNPSPLKLVAEWISNP
ncbi:MAG: Mur ligase family protein, partial [Bdellovibrionota bacterium]